MNYNIYVGGGGGGGVLPDMFNMRLMRPLNPSNDTDLCRMVGSC